MQAAVLSSYLYLSVLVGTWPSEEWQEYFWNGLRPPGQATQAASISAYWFSSATSTTTFTNKKLLVVVSFLKKKSWQHGSLLANIFKCISLWEFHHYQIQPSNVHGMSIRISAHNHTCMGAKPGRAGTILMRKPHVCVIVVPTPG